ncbi:MAG: DUF1080 domain-containing protein [Bacteroidota bacterium]|nr:DUF1080 domain-containing protein [Bacteroidota bacterium]MDP4211886.1 DUF1080 domain-containing protein [Bacteroidota bacterium]MDP4248525.1 DUF1080 domain-containing protein [Bacteroidota bacterium]
MAKQFGIALVALALLAGSVQAQTANNQLTAAEKSAGWQLLFDGTSTKGWHTYNKKTISDAWRVDDGTLHLDASKRTSAGAGDIDTRDEFRNFDLKMQWKISKAGNSGIIFLVHESPKFEDSYETGPEMQVLDNKDADDGKNYKHHAGDLYDLIPSNSESIVHGVGEWNDVEIKLYHGKLDFYMNGKHTVSTTLWTAQWNALVKGSKFAKMPAFATFKSGHIDLQDHGHDVWYRNIKIKKL